MRLGYAAYQREDYRVAAFYFRSALYEVPRDRDATTAYWNAKNAIKERQDGDNTDIDSAYDRYMEMGYDATEAGDYERALEQFQKAQDERPEDYYAIQAIRNVKTYINRGTEATATEVATAPAFYEGELPYDRYMRLGYAAQQRQDYAAALSYYRSALYERPNDRQATIAFWNTWDIIKDGKRESDSSEGETIYDRYMRLGYDATERQNYSQALEFFEKALVERPEDEYATQAIRNVQTYMERGETLSSE